MTRSYLLSAPGAETVEVSGAFPHPIDRVWRAWTEPERLKRWFGSQGSAFATMEADVRVGGRWRFELTDGPPPSTLEGEYLVVEPHHRLVFTWTYVQQTDDGAEATPTSQVSVNFRKIEGGAEVSLRHERIQTDGARRNVGGGWNDSFVRLQATLAEKTD